MHELSTDGVTRPVEGFGRRGYTRRCRARAMEITEYLVAVKRTRGVPPTGHQLRAGYHLRSTPSLLPASPAVCGRRGGYLVAES